LNSAQGTTAAKTANTPQTAPAAKAATMARTARTRGWPPAGALPGSLGPRAALVPLLMLLAAAPPAAAADWPQFGYDSRHTGSNPAEAMLGAANVAALHARYHVVLPGVVDGPPVFLQGAATPQGARDLLFLETRRGMLLALDAATGATVWSRRPANQPGYTTSSPAIDPDRRFV